MSGTALFSDVDWAILLIVGGFLLFGRENRAILRTLGRYYGRAVRLKQDLLSEVSRAADLPLPSGGQGVSLRGALLGYVEPAGRLPGVPVAVAAAPTGPPPALATSWAGAVGPGTWSVALPTSGLSERGPR